MRQLEFKICIEHDFNHPLQTCDDIVVWTRGTCVSVVDSSECTAEVMQPTPDEQLHGVGYYLANVQRGNQEVVSRLNMSQPLRVRVIVLSELLEKTFAAYTTVQQRRPDDVADKRSASKRKR